MPESQKKRLFWAAGTLLLLAAAIAVAIAVPLSTGGVEEGGSDNPHRQLTARGVTAAQRTAQQKPAEPACQGVPGLCKVPVRLVTFPGTHNSNAMQTDLPNLFEHQQLTFAEQLKAGARLFDLDFAGRQGKPRFGHCMSCLCAFSRIESENDPVKVFKTMGDFLAANPREVLVIGLSNVNCGDKEQARQQVLAALAASPLAKFFAVAPISATVTIGDLVAKNQRAIFLFYDEWTTPTGFKIGGKFVPNQPLWRIYGEGVSITGQDAATIDNQVAQGLLNQVIKQVSAQQPELTTNTPWRIMGLFPSTCMICRAANVCGPISCADKANDESFILYILGKATSRWTRNRSADQSQLVPAFNAFQIDYLQAAPKANVVTAARKLNAAIAWMYTAQPAAAPKLGLANCVWVLDDTAASGGLACVQDRSVKIQSLLGVPAASAAANGRRRLQQAAPAAAGSKRYILVPANPALTLRLGVGGKMGREVKGIAGKPQLLDLSLSATDLQVAWV